MTTPLNPPPQRYSNDPSFWRAFLTSIYHLFSRVKYIDSAPNRWTSGEGSPENNVTGIVGDLYSRTDGGSGTSLYVKESGTGNTGWSGV